MTTETLRFPRGFVWGVGTSAYQVEGATGEDGRGESIWDRFAATPGKIKEGQTADVACDHYHRYEQDLDLIQRLGIPSYRFSIAWPRIQPLGAGTVNQKGLDFYRRLVDGLLARNIQPMATLYHWDLPQALQDQGGWGSRETALRFGEYAETMFRALGDSVPAWLTHNEPWVTAFMGHADGCFAPGLRDILLTARVTHHLQLSHGLAVQAFQALGLGGSIGIALNLRPAYAATESREDRAAAELVHANLNRMFLDPLLLGAYVPMTAYDTPYGVVDWESLPAGGMAHIQPEDLGIISTPIDFLGVNYYNPITIKATAEAPFFTVGPKDESRPVTGLGWEIAPQGLYDMLLRIKQDYGPLPLYVTENGAAYDDQPDAEGQVDDWQRIEFLSGHFAAAWRAIAAGVDLRGFYIWSLLDNFEWADGYAPRFGIVYVDYPTQRRIPKRSALWYGEVIAGSAG